LSLSLGQASQMMIQFCFNLSMGSSPLFSCRSGWPGPRTLCRQSRLQSRQTVPSTWLHVGATWPTTNPSPGQATGQVRQYQWIWEPCSSPPDLPQGMWCATGVAGRAISAGTAGSSWDPTRGATQPAGGLLRGPLRRSSSSLIFLLHLLHVVSLQKTDLGAGIGQPRAGAGPIEA
jgi:hypothetical protein